MSQRSNNTQDGNRLNPWQLGLHPPSHRPQQCIPQSLDVQVLPRQTSGVSGPPTITQQELAEYQALKLQEKAVSDRIADIRASLLQRLEAGAAIEPGNLTARKQIRELQRFTLSKMAALLGQEHAAALRNRLEPTVSIFLIVQATADST